MYIKRKIILSIPIVILLLTLGYFLFIPDIYSGMTRINGLKESINDNTSLVNTYYFIQEIESVRSRFELGKKMSLESASQRDKCINGLLIDKKDSEELLTYLKTYGNSMYLSMDGTGTYQVVFFSVLEKLADNSLQEIGLKEELLRLKDEFSLNDTDLGEYSAIINHQLYP